MPVVVNSYIWYDIIQLSNDDVLALYRIVMPPCTTLLNFKNGYFFSEISLSNIHILKLEDMIVQLI